MDYDKLLERYLLKLKAIFPDIDERDYLKILKDKLEDDILNYSDSDENDEKRK